MKKILAQSLFMLTLLVVGTASLSAPAVQAATCATNVGGDVLLLPNSPALSRPMTEMYVGPGGYTETQQSVPSSIGLSGGTDLVVSSQGYASTAYTDSELCINGDVFIDAHWGVGFGAEGVTHNPLAFVHLRGDVYLAEGATLTTKTSAVQLIIDNLIIEESSGTGGTPQELLARVTQLEGSYGEVVINNLTFPETDNIQTTNTQDTSDLVVVSNKETLTNSASIGNTSVYPKGILSGSGSSTSVDVLGYGAFAPGNSPGCYTSGDLSFADSTSVFEVELAGTTVCSEYDQTDVTGLVTLNDATLNLSLLSGADAITSEDELIIINNDGTDAVVGTFSGLAEGAQISTQAAGTSFIISYIGGDGNDVSLTLHQESSETESSLTEKVVEATDKQPSLDVVVPLGEALVVNGERGDITVDSGAALKGNGSVGDINILTGGRLAPGESPGCLANGNLALSGTYEVEIEGTTVCSQYDQDQVTGTVNITGALIDIQRLSTFIPGVGDEFIVISNDSTDAVVGTFVNPVAGIGDWVEGLELEIDSITYSMSYVGGDGNDVVLTVTDAPETLAETGIGVAALPILGVFSVVATAFTVKHTFGRGYSRV